MNIKERKALVMLARAPIPGTVKTSFCPPLNYKEAAQLYIAMFEDTMALMKETDKFKDIDLFLAHYSPGG